MLTRSSVAVAVACALFACDRLPFGSKKDAPATSDSSAAVNATTTATAAATAAGAIGVPECDSLLGEYDCLLHKTMPNKADADSAIAKMRDGWKAAAATDVGRNTIKQTCASTRSSMVQALQQNGCVGASGSTTVAATATTTTATATATTESTPGRCTRRSCDLGKEVCCESFSTGAHQCVSRGHLGDRVHCGLGADWALAMDCAQYTGCGPTKVCCKEPLVGHAGFTVDLCEETCNAVEACVENGQCKGDHGCKTDPTERSGGICVLPPKVKKPPQVAKQGNDCPAGYMMDIDSTYCGLMCHSPEDCGANGKCMNDHSGGPTYCMK